MTEALPDDAEILGTLDELIERLSKSKRGADLRNALHDAKRLRSATLKWGIIPPPPDARRELLDRVAQLLALAAGAQADGDDGERPPESARSRSSRKARGAALEEKPARGAASLGSRIHDEATKPEGRFPSIHDEETAPLPSRPPTAAERRRGKARAEGAYAKSVHDEDTAPGPEVRAAQAVEARVIRRPEIADEETVREGYRKAAPPKSSPTPVAAPPSKAPSAPPPKAPSPTPPKVPSAPPPKAPSAPPPKSPSAPPAPHPKLQRTQSGAVALAPLQDLDLSDLELFAAPPSKSSLSASPQLPPIVMPALSDGGAAPKSKIEGFSTSVSTPKMAAVRPPPSKPTEPLPAVKEASGVTIVRGNASAWRPLPAAPAVLVRTVQSTATGVIALVKLPVSARVPSKRVDGEVQLFVLIGGITLGPHELAAGDACRLEKGSTRQAITTTGPATILYVGPSLGGDTTDPQADV
ncbi:MAG: hypothetical protein U0414_27395 [Polyangiaceae bacterium]